MFRQILNVLGGELLIEHIDMATLDRYVTRRRGDGKAPSTVNREISVLRHALHLAARWKAETKLSRYRLADWTPLREAPFARQAVFLTREEVARVLAAARDRAARGGLNGLHGEAVIQMALATGARLGEILSLNWDDLDENGVVRIRTEKNGPDRSIQLPEETLKAPRTVPRPRERLRPRLPQPALGPAAARHPPLLARRAESGRHRARPLPRPAPHRGLRDAPARHDDPRRPVRPRSLDDPHDGALRPLRSLLPGPQSPDLVGTLNGNAVLP